MPRTNPMIASSMVFLLLALASGQLWAQHGGSHGGYAGRSAIVGAGHSVAVSRVAATSIVGPGGRVYVAAPRGAATLLAGAPANNDGSRPFSPVAPPAVGNINQPGLPPGAPVVIPNINNPAGLPARGPYGRPFGNPGGRRWRGVPGAVIVPYYGAPYAPYYYGPDYSYQEAPPVQEPAPLEPWEPTQQGNAPSGPRLYYVAPEATGGETEDPFAPAEPPPAAAPATPVAPAAPTAPESPAAPQTLAAPETAAAPNAKPRPVTLLAFKDQTVVAVTDFWLKGETVFYLKSGKETGIPLAQIDLLLTQQLNFERHVPFVLESRP